MQLPPASQRHRSTPAVPVAPTGPRLRGWLIPLAIGLVLLPLRIVLFLLEDLAPVFTKEVWTALTSPGSPAYHPLNAPVLLFELVGNVLLLLCSLVVVVGFFLKRRWFPRVAVGFLAGMLLFYVVDYLATERLLTAQGLPSGGPIWDLLGAGGLCGIVVPYLLRSQRVQNTFLR